MSIIIIIIIIYSEYQLLPSGKRYRIPKRKLSRCRYSFTAFSIKEFNEHMQSVFYPGSAQLHRLAACGRSIMLCQNCVCTCVFRKECCCCCCCCACVSSRRKVACRRSFVLCQTVYVHCVFRKVCCCCCA